MRGDGALIRQPGSSDNAPANSPRPNSTGNHPTAVGLCVACCITLPGVSDSTRLPSTRRFPETALRVGTRRLVGGKPRPVTSARLTFAIPGQVAEPTSLSTSLAPRESQQPVAGLPPRPHYVSAFRARYDPASAAALPPHVTVHYPFLQSSRISKSVIQALTKYLSGLLRLRITFFEARRFPGVIYLAPTPDAPLREMTCGLADLFPRQCPTGESTLTSCLTSPWRRQTTKDDLRRSPRGSGGRRKGVFPFAKVGAMWKPKMSFSLGKTPCEQC